LGCGFCVFFFGLGVVCRVVFYLCFFLSSFLFFLFSFVSCCNFFFLVCVWGGDKNLCLLFDGGKWEMCFVIRRGFV